jgi:hypothetical protein
MEGAGEVVAGLLIPASQPVVIIFSFNQPIISYFSAFFMEREKRGQKN